MRYYTPDETGETRLERNARFGQEDLSPPLDVPALGQHIWTWYWDLTRCLARVRDGVCEPYPPSEFVAWLAETGEIVNPSERDILRAMDDAYCVEMNKELADYRARQEEAAKKPK